MKAVVNLLLLSLVWVSCKSGFKSCKDFCSASQSNPLASVKVKGDYRCYKMRGAAYKEGKKQGHCDDWTKTTGNKPKHPDPVKCQALIDAAQKSVGSFLMIHPR